jgi:Flp pilus assembly pilin Flp
LLEIICKLVSNKDGFSAIEYGLVAAFVLVLASQLVGKLLFNL